MHVQSAFGQQNIITYSTKLESKRLFVIDVGDKEKCEQRSVAGARCLPATDFIGPSGDLANFSGLLWLLGTIGLTGKEHVLLVGGTNEQKEFVAGLLYIAGQHRVSILTTRVGDLEPSRLGEGESRSRTREKIYIAPMRSKALILPGELNNSMSEKGSLIILDGRSASKSGAIEQGSSIPGSTSFRVPDEQGAIRKKRGEIVVYGGNSEDSFIALAKLVAAGGKARALLGGWQGWITHTHSHARTSKDQKWPMFRLIVFAFLSIMILAAFGFFYSKLQTRNKDD